MDTKISAASIVPKHVYVFECFDKDGNLKWREVVENLTVNEGLDDILTQYWKGSAYTAAHYVGLADTPSGAAAGDTMANHTGWTEITAYNETARPQLTWGVVSGQSVSASAVTFSINANATVGGGFVTTDSTKGGTTTGKLIGVAAFASSKTVSNGDTLNVTVTASALSA